MVRYRRTLTRISFSNPCSTGTHIMKVKTGMMEKDGLDLGQRKFFSFGFAVLKTFLVRRRTQKYKGALFEQLESGCA